MTLDPKQKIQETTNVIYGENFDTELASKYLHLAKQTLANFRHQRRGPKYIKLSGKILYRRADLDEYLNSRLIDPENDAR